MNDHQAIAAAVVEYANAVDARDWTTVRRWLADDCEMQPGDERLVGPDAIIGWLAPLMDQVCTWSVHRMTNTVADIDGDTARVRSYEDTLLFSDDKAKPPRQLVGITDDTMRRTDTGWKFTRRSLSTVRYLGFGND